MVMPMMNFGGEQSPPSPHISAMGGVYIPFNIVSPCVCVWFVAMGLYGSCLLCKGPGNLWLAGPINAYVFVNGI